MEDMLLKSIFRTLCAYLLCIAISPVWASTIYTYTGNNFDTFTGSLQSHDSSMNVTVSLEYTNPLLPNLAEQFQNPLSFSISDGLNTINNSNVVSSNFSIGTDSSGDIASWFIFAAATGVYIETISSTIITGIEWDYGRTTIDNVANIRDDPGSWSVSPVPIPAAVWLFGTALIGLIGFGKRRKAT
jgi:hypothetical protein